MSDDILADIDASIARNRARFDPFGEAWDQDLVERHDGAMRVLAVRAPVADPEPLVVSSPTAPRVSFADVAAGPSADGDPATVDVRRRAQDGNDPVTAAMRAAVLRQGLTECEIDGVRQVYRDGEWLAAGGFVEREPVEALRPEFPGVLVDPTFVFSDSAGNFEDDAHRFRMHYARYGPSVQSRPERLDQPEPDAALVDASSDTAPDVPRTSKITELYAALRARARRGGTR